MDIDIAEYVDDEDRSPFEQWFEKLDGRTAAKVTVAIARMAQGNLSKAKSVGSGVIEYKIDFGPGYRIYFGREGKRIIILLGGGDKKRQAADIAAAKKRWRDYKQRKKA